MRDTATTISADRKQAALADALGSRTFARSDQLRSFLQYVCEKEIAGEGAVISEYVIAVEALGRPATYSSGEEATVRNRAYQLRHKLLEFYTQERPEAEIRIELPKGSYCPRFVEVFAATLSPVPEEAPTAPPPTETIARPARGRRRIALAACLLLALAAILTPVFWARSKRTALEEFWRPMLNHPQPVLICVIQSVMYGLTEPTEEKTARKRNRPPEPDRTEYDLLAEEAIRGGDLHARPYFVSAGSAVALAQIHALLARWNKPSQLRLGNEASFVDMRQAPVVSLGAFGNRWTMTVANKQRFYFEQKNFFHKVIRDAGNPNRVWGPDHVPASGLVEEDFALITRLFESDTGQVLLSAAGITMFGTRAAGELLTDEAMFETLAAQAPPGWQKMNLQILFSVKVIDHVPGPPKILATHFW
ncbi:MAG: hypothetical protein SF339_15155 [Blastocatellia bacterium]|nr:hypothetical protein [Blastocatellia bacterium]